MAVDCSSFRTLNSLRHLPTSPVNAFQRGNFPCLQFPFHNSLTSPLRAVHAKAAGAYGKFVVTHDISHITSAAFLNGIGKETPVLLRISTVGPEKGSADSVRDPRGWGMKLFTEEGNQDWVFYNTPIFFVRDPLKQ